MKLLPAPFRLDGRGILTLLVFASASMAHAYELRLTMLDLAERSSVAFVGKVSEVDRGPANLTVEEALHRGFHAASNDTATLTVEEVLSGKLARGDTVRVRATQNRGVGGLPFYVVDFEVGERVLIFGETDDQGRVRVVAGRQGKVRLNPQQEAAELEAARRILVIAHMSEARKAEAMLSEARSKNERLRSEACGYVAFRLAQSEYRNQCTADLVSLIDETDPEIQWAGLTALQRVRAPAAIPRMAELSRGTNLKVVMAASMALRRYDTPESTAALIALTKHSNPDIRMRACLDTDESERPEAKAALRRLLEDPDPKVRAMGARGLVYWLRRKQADEVVPKLIEMLGDADPEVRASAGRHLGECRDPAPVPALLAALGREPSGGAAHLALLQALEMLSSDGGAKARELIDGEIRLIVQALERGAPDQPFGPSFAAVGILSRSSTAEARDALKWAAQSHPNDEIRAYAQRSLAR